MIRYSLHFAGFNEACARVGEERGDCTGFLAHGGGMSRAMKGMIGVRQTSGLGRENIQGALEVVGDGGEVDLDCGFGETSPSHSAQAIAALPCAEDLLDPPSDAMDGLVPLVALAQRFGFIAAPHAGCDNAGNTALRPHGT